jgi:hypothetical protein
MKREYIAKYFIVYNNNELEPIAVEKTKMLNAMANDGWELENYGESTEATPEGFTINEIFVKYKTILNTVWSRPVEPVVEAKKPAKKATTKKAK